MNSFEFLPLATIGQFFPTGSIFHRRASRARLVFFSLILLAITFSTSLLGVIAALVITLIGLVLSRVPLKYALKGLLAPLPFLIFIALLQLLFFSSTAGTVVYFEWGIIHITQSSCLASILLLLRFLTLILWLSLMSFCLSSSEAISAMSALLSPLNRLGIHTMDLVMSIQVAMRFLPLLAQTAERIAKAQASRGAEWGTKKGGLIAQIKRIVPLIVPLFVISLRRSDTMALAMDARAYGIQNQRTSLYPLQWTWRDVLMLLVGAALAVGILMIK
jgi:energy-coupling factor transport system permease protein